MPDTSLPLHAWSAHALIHAYRQGHLSPVEVTQSVLDHIAQWEPHLCASYLLRPELALMQAQASEARWLKGVPCGALDGVPVTIKENISTVGDPSPLGTLAMSLITPRTATLSLRARACP